MNSDTGIKLASNNNTAATCRIFHIGHVFLNL